MTISKLFYNVLLGLAICIFIAFWGAVAAVMGWFIYITTWWFIGPLLPLLIVGFIGLCILLWATMYVEYRFTGKISGSPGWGSGQQPPAGPRT